MTVELLPEAEVHLQRPLPDGGLLEFDYKPIGTPTQEGRPRKVPYRAYHVVKAGKREKRRSVTTILGQIVSKDLSSYGEREGVYGTMEAFRRGELDPKLHRDDEALTIVRDLKLGVDAHRKKAADRGLDIHALLEKWMSEGEIPNPSDFPIEQRGFIQALARAVVSLSPEPIAVEQLVCSEASSVPYAGRVDLLAKVDGKLTLIDLKTQEFGSVYSGAHVQTAMYARALDECGDGYPESVLIVGLARDGGFRCEESLGTDATVDAALAWYSFISPLESAVGRANAAERRARLAA